MIDDQDFKAKVTREEFETMCADLFDRIAATVQEALKTSEMTLVRIYQLNLYRIFVKSRSDFGVIHYKHYKL